MIFPYAVKHNGVLYEAGKKVPIGQEPKKELQVEDKTASELSKELKERFDIDMAPQMGKAKLQKALEEAEAKAKEDEKSNEENDEESDLVGDLTNGNPDDEGNEDDGEPEEDDEESFLDKIINE